MEFMKFDTLEDVQNAVIDFYKVPIRSRFIVSNKIHKRLKELNSYVKVNKGNPILNYPSERFIVNYDSTENEYSKYIELLDESIDQFNAHIYEDIQSALVNLTGINDCIRLCREQNNKADDLYLKKFPTHSEVIGIFKKAVSKIELCFLYELVDSIANTAIDDIIFIINQGVLSKHHIKRLLSSPMHLLKMPIFSKRMENIRPRLAALNTDTFDEFRARLPYNTHQLESYLRYNKIGFEEELINMDTNGDYKLNIESFDVDTKMYEAVKENVIETYGELIEIDVIDKFKLEEHGFGPIDKVSKNSYVHMKNGKQYNLYRGNKSNVYYMITESAKGLKSYKITLNAKESLDNLTSDVILESTFITSDKISK